MSRLAQAGGFASQQPRVPPLCPFLQAHLLAAAQVLAAHALHLALAVEEAQLNVRYLWQVRPLRVQLRVQTCSRVGHVPAMLTPSAAGEACEAHAPVGRRRLALLYWHRRPRLYICALLRQCAALAVRMRHQAARSAAWRPLRPSQPPRAWRAMARGRLNRATTDRPGSRPGWTPTSCASSRTRANVPNSLS